MRRRDRASICGFELDRAVSPVAPARAARPGERLLGLDEAGRGSVLGPLVIGGFLCAPDDAARLRAIGVRDSKQLTAPRREAVLRELAPMGRRLTVVFPPAVVDRAVRRNRLNRLEADGFAALIRRADPTSVFLDACEVNTARFGAEVATKAGFAGPLDARNHADRDLPIVGAASIVAKVHRDAALARLQRRVGRPIGSGYPHDPTTRAYVAEALGAGQRAAPGIRRSWKTTETIMAARTRTTLDRFPS